MKKLFKSLSENVSKECFRDIVEEIINEVSVKRWKEAAKNSVEGRKQAASDASDRFGRVVYPFRPEVNDPANKLGNAWDKAEQRADRAEQLAKNLPDSKRSANQLKQAAKKVVDKRDKDNENALDNLQNTADKYFTKQNHDDEDRKELTKAQHNWVGKQEKENKARNLVGKPERRPEKNSEGKHKLKEQGYIDRSNEALSESKPKDPEGYKKNIEIANHYDHLYSTSPAKSPDGGPNSVAAEWNRRYQEYFNKAMKCYYGDGSKKKAKNSANEAFIKAISLMEAIINEISQETKDNAWNKTYDEMVKFRGRLEDEKKRYKKGWSYPDKVMDAKRDLYKAEERYHKMDDAIRKHNRAKAVGKIKPSKGKEEKSNDSK